uniref:Nuclear nucleic acid-binding protein C1D n=2 Tax=Canis lupus TaxID=9612 RepID=A0A8I3MSL0_CANLF
MYSPETAVKTNELVITAGKEINENYPVQIMNIENSIGAVDKMLTTTMSVSRNELLQKLDLLEQAKVDLVPAYTLNSMFWVSSKLDKDAASRFVKNALWESKPKNASKVAKKGKANVKKMHSPKATKVKINK